jgi:hypothetical protein
METSSLFIEQQIDSVLAALSDQISSIENKISTEKTISNGLSKIKIVLYGDGNLAVNEDLVDEFSKATLEVSSIAFLSIICWLHVKQFFRDI